MRKLLLLTLMTISALGVVGAQAVPLRELIFQTIDQEHHGVLTPSEINAGRRLGAKWYRVRGDYFPGLESASKASARALFPHDAAKQREWALEISIGFMMAAEAKLRTP
jgi:hypothetical protein